ncbi:MULTISPECIES: succinate dehydrogenase cytochrome b558 subunit [Paenibacillus]|jgi:succinate dehydrogenase / fumarate reductase cytochrome b subunit|uniref:Succinate dehydrogenase cytochrome b558 subunit n=1 Tax=Paenibacillus azoreducens TaxID=116718 RepID=A0A919YD26_9BACL|nr:MULTISPECIES: succinate dehydrogenase cytochrome b558 subunit [Paenibacillus]MBE9915970.1 succinate dehydrogenase [Paenibacillus donghaensis]GIO46575.1 succinate dehydrogenase cytochrome b558 subunit [Paenibacillus azoreducens]
MNGYYSRKLHSLLGVIPLGLFFINHALTNFGAFEGGPARFNAGVKLINDLPLIFVLEWVVIYLPLIYHGVFGLYMAYQSKPNNGNYQYSRNWRYLFQRITGVITFVFIIWHVYETRVQIALGRVTHEELGNVMHNIMVQPGLFTLYLIGVISAAFHFANGLWSFFVSWGITVGPRAQRVSSYICMTLFVLVSIMLVLAMVAFRGAEFQAATGFLDTVKSVFS